MKHFLLSAALVLAVAATFSACKKSDNNTTTPTVTTTAMTAKVNGNPFTATFISGNSSSSNGNMPNLYIDGMDASGNDITLIVLSDSTLHTGTYTTDNVTASAEYSTFSGNSSYATTTGQFTITSYSNKVAKGTFNFTTADSTRITDGTFTVIMP